MCFFSIFPKMSTEFWQLIAWLIVLSIGIFLYHSGLLHDVHVMLGRPPFQQEITIAYVCGTGPFKKAGSLYKEVSKLVPKSAKMIGIYYDDPKTTEAQNLRWIVGVVTKIGEEMDLPEEIVGRLKENRYNFHKLPAINDAVITSFPYNTFLSIFIAVSRVYPRISQYVQENQIDAYPAVEVFLGKSMYFYWPLQNQPQFFVPQVQKKTN